MMGVVSHAEVVPGEISSRRWKDISISTGASQSTLQDIKLPESAGGYVYRDSCIPDSPVSNCFIYWRVSNDTLELAEVSVDFNLIGNEIRLRFQHSPLLGGLGIHETQEHVIILVATVSSVHRLCFPHPCKLRRPDILTVRSTSTFRSVFYDTTAATLHSQANYHVFNHTSVGLPLPRTSCTWLTPQREAVFVLANAAGSLQVITLSNAEDGGKVTTFELKRSSVMSRLWNGLVPLVMRPNQEGEDTVLNLVWHCVSPDYLIVTLCRDLRIRMWSYRNKECIMTESVLPSSGDSGNSSSVWQMTGRPPSLRKATVGDTFLLAVFLSFPEQNQFHIFQPVEISGQYCLSPVATLDAPEDDLVDFCLTSHLWTLWLNSNSEPVVRYTSIDNDPVQESSQTWKIVSLQPPTSRNVSLYLSYIDPREAYLQEIFYRRAFPVAVIAKAISIYRRVVDNTVVDEDSIAVQHLQNEVVTAVETEIHLKATESELMDEDYLHLQVECWERFLSYCIQYHEVGTKPLGLFVDSSTGLAVVVKKNQFSLLFPCDPLEQLVLSAEHGCSPLDLVGNPLISEGPPMARCLLAMLDAVVILRKHLSEEVLFGFEQELFHLQTPESLAALAVKDLTSNCSFDLRLKPDLQSVLQTASNPIGALQTLLTELDLTDEAEASGLEGQALPGWNLCCSSVGLSLLSEILGRVARHRFSLCRDLLILQTLMLEMGKEYGLSDNDVQVMQAEILPATSRYVRAYYVVMWATTYPYTAADGSSLESGVRQLSLLDLTDTLAVPVGKQHPNQSWGSVVHLFLQTQGSARAHAVLAYQLGAEEPCETTSTALLPKLVSILLHLMWPMGMRFPFPEFLLGSSQFLALQEYLHLVQRWCEWNSSSWQFLLATCYLNSGECPKAVDMFCRAADGITTDEFLHSKLLQLPPDAPANERTSQYYLKVIHLFECSGFPDGVISLTKRVLLVADKDDPNVPTLWSVLFKYELEIGHDDEAYKAMISNPDLARRKDCLRRFLAVLCARKEFRTLVRLSYVDMLDDVVSILESWARATDITVNNYYELLYAFHIHHSNYRKAATVMYEMAMRLGREGAGIDSLQRQCWCYLSTLNCLQLVNPLYMWIVKPVPSQDMHDPPSISPKRNSDGDEVSGDKTPKKKRAEVLEYNDIRKEYHLALALLWLAQKDPTSGPKILAPLSPGETVSLLVSAELFEEAISLCRLFEMSLAPVIEGLTSRCLIQPFRQSFRLPKDVTSDWDARPDDLLSGTDIIDQCELWQLLKSYVEKYEAPAQTIYHRIVAHKLMAHGSPLPTWLKASYKKRNCAELLYLYLNHNLLDEATTLAIEYLDAVLGIGKEYFGLKHGLHFNVPAVWVPYTALDNIMRNLDSNSSNPHYYQLCQDFSSVLDKYSKTAAATSKDMISRFSTTYVPVGSE